MRKKIILGILGALAVLIIGFVAVAAMQPSEFHIARSATMAAAPDEVFTQVNDFHKWESWSPWLKIDPNAKTTYEGPSEGEGAIFRWAGNSEVGEGSMTIIESRPHEHIRIKLDFLKPFENTANAEFAFKPVDDKTNVTWSMSGKNNLLGKVMCLLMNMDKMIGDKYDEGLANMKKIVEAPPPNQPEPAAPTSATEPPAKTES
jgi:polyketide cyclase/dehydrase/lipid transport protein